MNPIIEQIQLKKKFDSEILQIPETERKNYQEAFDEATTLEDKRSALEVLQERTEKTEKETSIDDIYFESKEKALDHLKNVLFPIITSKFRLFKTPKMKNDEYLVIDLDWLGIDDDRQSYAKTSDVVDRLASIGVPPKIFYTKVIDKDKTKDMPLDTLEEWRRSPETQASRLNGLDWVPAPKSQFIGSKFNTFRDLSIEPKPGVDTSEFFNHIKKNLCGNNEEIYEYVINWYAHMFQEPTQRPLSAIAFLSESEGIGKGILTDTIARLLGGNRNVNSTLTSKDTANFNTAVAGKLFLVWDESTFAGNHEQADFMKRLTTEQYLRVEPKNMDAYQIQNYSRVNITSNSVDSAVSETIGGRRWLIVECPSIIDPSHSQYLKELASKIGLNEPKVPGIPGYLNSIMHEFKTRDISKFDPAQIPKHSGAADSKLTNTYHKNSIYAFLCEWIRASDLTIYFPSIERSTDGSTTPSEMGISLTDKKIRFATFREAYEHSCRARYARPVGANILGKRLEQYGFTISPGAANIRYLNIPDPVALLTELKRSSRNDILVTPEQEEKLMAISRARADVFTLKTSRA